MPNYWRQQGVPHKGWTLVDVIDVRADGQPEWDTEYEICMMCGNEKIRYVHILQHQEVDQEFRVGCTCAEKMTNDYVNPERRENELRNKANRRISWRKKQWKKSKNGNHYLKVEDRILVIYKDKRTSKYNVKIADIFGNKSFDTLEQAKVAAFNGMEYLKECDKW